MTKYPVGYYKAEASLDNMRTVYGKNMHPVFADALFAYIEYKEGVLGIGSGFRITQPTKPGFAPDGMSFHQLQTFASGIQGYCAVDLVWRNGSNNHRAPTFAETDDAELFNLHTFIGEHTSTITDDEPWHIQPINIRGYQSWVANGKPDPKPRKVLIMYSYVKVIGGLSLFQVIAPGVVTRIEPFTLTGRHGGTMPPATEVTREHFDTTYVVVNNLPGISAR